ncbi:MAG: bifunctional diaminohydroxyphosphoribosylaminopyrimidine deaminase/5-amino-6-(5-phosphoribosylamino)uracil reductase RibD [Eubacteriales bacterium]
MEEKYMKKALELAKLGEGYTSPNPLVGALIVKKGKIIAEGYHEKYGENHAEVNAFLDASEDVKGADMYVTLEPCSHQGKTPPCADRIVKEGIKRVFIGMKDPNPLVAGRGVEILEKNGIEVKSGILEKEAVELNEIFIKYITENKPFCILKTAMSLDGKIATSSGDSKWISNEKSRKYVHQLRHRVSGIMVGIGTVLADDPMLTTRLENKKGKDPHRIIIDTEGRIPLDSKILNLKSHSKTIIATTEKISSEKVRSLEDKNAEVVICPLKNNKVDLNYLFDYLAKMGIDSILVEGESTLNESLLKENLIDKVITFIAPKIIGGSHAKTPVAGEGFKYVKDAVKLENIKTKYFDEDIMISGYIRKEV